MFSHRSQDRRTGGNGEKASQMDRGVALKTTETFPRGQRGRLAISVSNCSTFPAGGGASTRSAVAGRRFQLEAVAQGTAGDERYAPAD